MQMKTVVCPIIISHKCNGNGALLFGDGTAANHEKREMQLLNMSIRHCRSKCVRVRAPPITSTFPRPAGSHAHDWRSVERIE